MSSFLRFGSPTRLNGIPLPFVVLLTCIVLDLTIFWLLSLRIFLQGIINCSVSAEQIELIDCYEVNFSQKAFVVEFFLDSFLLLFLFFLFSVFFFYLFIKVRTFLLKRFPRYGNSSNYKQNNEELFFILKPLFSLIFNFAVIISLVCLHLCVLQVILTY